MTRWITPTLGILLAAAFFTTSASAAHESPLYFAADDYRDAICHFEHEVIRLRYVSREDKRLVDRLEDLTSRLRSESRRGKDFDRLACTWEEVQRLNYAVNVALFHRPCYPCNPQLEQCWQNVENAFNAYDVAFRHCALGAYDSHDHAYGPQQEPLYPERFERPQIVPQSVLPQPFAPVEPIRSMRPSFGNTSPYGAPSTRPNVPILQVERFSSDRHRVDSRVDSRYPPHPVSSRQIGAAIVGALLARAME